MTQKKSITRTIAFSFFGFWLIVLYLGADHSPPPGFLFLIGLNIGCSIVVYYRAGTYYEWIEQNKKGRLLRVLVDGLAAGFIVALLTKLLPGTGEPGIPPRGPIDNSIWIASLGIVGSINALGVFGLTALLRRCRRAAGRLVVDK